MVSGWGGACPGCTGATLRGPEAQPRVLYPTLPSSCCFPGLKLSHRPRRHHGQHRPNNAITEIKSTLEGTNSRITEAEDRISEAEDRMVEINAAERKKEQESNPGLPTLQADSLPTEL